MVEKFIKLLRGLVLISVRGGQPERFLNLCAARGITLEKLRHNGDMEMTAVLSLKDFFLLRPIRSKTGVHIRVLAKHGLPFFFYRNKKRKAFFLGILVCLLLIAGLSRRIWGIHIEGNLHNTTPELLEFLEEEGVSHGMSKKAVDCSRIAASIRKKYPDIIWAAARIEGAGLFLNVQEGILLPVQKTEEKPCSLVSGLDGIIVKMVTRKGVPVLRTGDACKKGELLVSGILPIINDSQEVIRQEAVHADADIYVKHPLAYYHAFPLKYRKETPAGKVKNGFFVRIGKLYLGFYPKTGKNRYRITEEKPIYLTENFRLPVSLGKVRQTPYKNDAGLYTDEQAKALALERLHLFEEKLLKKGMEITENQVSIKIKNGECSARGYLTVIEKTGSKVPVQQIPAMEDGA